MRRFLIALTPQQRLALLALGLGLVALPAQPYRGPVASLDARELALVVQREADHVEPQELAAWIVAGKSDYRLVDLREAAAFEAYHVPTAENRSLVDLPGEGLLRSEKIVLYSDGGIHAAQAWMLLRAQGYRGVYALRGGLEGWKDEVLFPALADDATPQQRTRVERSESMARFFGGQPRTGLAAAAGSAPALPKLELPQAPAGGAAPASARKPKKKEGC